MPVTSSSLAQWVVISSTFAEFCCSYYCRRVSTGNNSRAEDDMI